MAHAWTSSNPSLTIPETTNVKFRGEVWTVYKMKVVDGERTFFVEKRFNAFAQFHDILIQAFGQSILPKFPKASFFENKFDPAVIARRRKDLENYMNTLLTDERFLNSIYLREFLQPPPTAVPSPLSQPATFPPSQPAYQSQPPGFGNYNQQPPMQQSYYQPQPPQGYYQPPYAQFAQPPPVQQGYYQQQPQQGYYQQPIQPPLPGSLYQQPLPEPLPNQTFSPPPVPPNTKIPDRFVHSGQQISLNAILQEACRNFAYLSMLENELALYQSLHNERIELIKKNAAELANVSTLLTIETEILERIAASLQTVSVNAALYITSYCSVIEHAKKYAQDLLLESHDETIPPELRQFEQENANIQDPNNDYPNFGGDRDVLSDAEYQQLQLAQFSEAPVEEPHQQPPPVQAPDQQLPPVEEVHIPIQPNNDVEEIAAFIGEFNKLNIKVENLLIEATHTNDSKALIKILQEDKETARVLIDKYAEQENPEFVATSRQLRSLIQEIDNTTKLLLSRQPESRPTNRLQFVQEKVYKYLPYLEKDLSDTEYTKIREKLKLLNKELTSLKNGEHKYPVAELEELQTILSDLLFKLDEKFKPEVSTAKQMAKDFQLKKAKEGHKAIEDEMFGL